MNQKKVHEMVCVIDKSRSMHGKEQATIQSYNEMIQKQNQESSIYITTTLFSDDSRVLHTHTPIKEVKPLTEREYYTEGNTALFDAIGKTFLQVEELLRGEVDPRVVVMIITDGLENASTCFSGEEILQLIRRKQKEGWEIMLFGTNLEMIDIAKRVGIKKENVLKYPDTEDGLRTSYQIAGRRFTEMLSV
ncbi:vWA domain-containing protein [Hespellia stercorisuis]|uniref:von Willebrand factor type A domain-containing protein n=1 Tax=Hespellia stercorisuis DSM 15480 TaxID=1121950 RepID=A0A1M6R5T4_9FIRM|nr:vWA domain-containing protein [Hespellia stercorisuis]SHK27708.1 von Willebrand factor type A domain-containing protein [Hespellia stercorisuis DSM 15480]